MSWATGTPKRNDIQKKKNALNQDTIVQIFEAPSASYDS